MDCGTATPSHNSGNRFKRVPDAPALRSILNYVALICSLCEWLIVVFRLYSYEAHESWAHTHKTGEQRVGCSTRRDDKACNRPLNLIFGRGGDRREERRGGEQD